MVLDVLAGLFDQRAYFLSHLNVASFVPGRIRCYSNLLKDNPQNALSLKNMFAKFDDLIDLQINTLTGSVLIKYEPCELIQHEALVKIEKELKHKFEKSKR